MGRDVLFVDLNSRNKFDFIIAASRDEKGEIKIETNCETDKESAEKPCLHYSLQFLQSERYTQNKW